METEVISKDGSVVRHTHTYGPENRDLVPNDLCFERRDACQRACIDARSSQASLTEKLEKKIDNLIFLAIGQLCALILTLLGVIIYK